MLCDVGWHDGSPVAPSPRQVLRRQVERAEALGFTPMFGSELEFFLLKETYEQAHRQGYEDLTPSVPYILDYHVLASTYDEPFIRQIRNGMQAAGIKVETSKGEAWPGQHEINFRYADALTMADNHVVYKNGAKEIAHLNGCSITFMAKPDHSWIGSSCHIHSSLWRGEGSAFAGETPTFAGWLAGQIANLKELAIFVAPNVNSYKRYAAGSWAPTTLAWGTTTGRAASGSSATGRRCARRRGSPAPTRTRTSRSRRSSPPGSTGSSASWSCRRRSRATPTSPTPTASRTRCARRSRRSRAARWPAPPSATRSSTTTSTTRAPSRSSSTASSRPTSGSGSSSVARPLIGVTAYAEPSVRWGAWEVPAAVIPLAYVQRIEAAGGRALLVPPSEEGSRRRSTRSTASSSPAAPTSTRPSTGTSRTPRRRGRAPSATAASSRSCARRSSATCPVLAVCRGSQVLNVARGGDLVQHLPDVVGDEQHKHTPGVFADHEVEVKEGTRLGSLLGARAPVKSHHHQGFGEVGDGLVESAWAEDGTLEALEDPSKRFAVGVLWHPEEGGGGRGALPRARRRAGGPRRGALTGGDGRRRRTGCGAAGAELLRLGR